MSFWDFFKFDRSDAEKQANYSRLHDKIASHLPADASEKDQVIMACVAGLLARVAYVDLKIECAEKSEMEKVLRQFTDLSEQVIKVVIETASDEIQELVGAENHLYCGPLNEFLTRDERHHILEALFAFAASDGIACAQESEEIRLISKSLLLEHKHFIAARATVIKKLGALQSQ